MADDISPLILIVEDKETYADGLKAVLERAIPNIKILVQPRNFANALDELPHCRPDVFIVDLYEDEYAPESLKGPELCQEIWKRRFRPIIIHSALPADPHIDVRLTKHPFYKYIGKGSETSLDEVAAQVKEFLAHAVDLRMIEDEVHAVLQTVAQDTAETICTAQKDPKIRSQTLVRSARRRVGASMDLAPLLSSEAVLPWEQYIVPPLESGMLMGDLLRKTNSNNEDPSSYRIVLTPSCDLVMRKGKAKVKAVMVAKCVGAKLFVQGVGLNVADDKAILKKQLAPILTQAQVNGYSPLPAYPGLWPEMAIKLRDIELLELEGNSDSAAKEFERIASIDSPFREQIAWAHMQIGSRPALPDRDIESWADGIIAAAQK